MINVTLGQLKNDITMLMKGTSLRQVNDFYGVAASAANRMLARITPDETRRTVPLTTPFWNNINDYALPADYKKMIEIRPQANRRNYGLLSNFSQTTPRQFNQRLDQNSFSIQWNNMIRTLRAQALYAGSVATLDSFEGASSNGLWSSFGDMTNLYTEVLNYVQGSSALGMTLSGVTGVGYIENTTAAIVDLSAYRYNDTSALYVYIPVGFASRFTNFKLRRGSSSLNFRESTVTTKADGTAFTDGWNLLLFNWATATPTGIPVDTNNQYRRFTVTTTAGPSIPSFLIDSWTDSLGLLYEIEYYSSYLFRNAAGSWVAQPSFDTDFVNVDFDAYEILKAEMMINITQIIRTGNVRAEEIQEWRTMLNGQPPNRYIKDPQYRGLYADYLQAHPSNAIPTVTKTYEFDL